MFASQTEGELKVTQVLKEKFPRATAIKVTDISGGCGAMYEIKIESEEFKEKRTVQQHQMVNQAHSPEPGFYAASLCSGEKPIALPSRAAARKAALR
ncbi:BolA-like protein 3 [Microtus ochrogaster]|uniref:BolA-like protein 3 n=1 Tax=Microtus ochrogaster TaxID=79684 RepID=A0A8J6GRM6_MICOH|nr:BolA-like protein 3 [Microtus ochrogaster]